MLLLLHRNRETMAVCDGGVLLRKQGRMCAPQCATTQHGSGLEGKSWPPFGSPPVTGTFSSLDVLQSLHVMRSSCDMLAAC